MAILASTESYCVETQRVGTLVTRRGDGATLFLQPGDDENLFFDSVFGVHDLSDLTEKQIEDAIDAYSELFIVEI